MRRLLLPALFVLLLTLAACRPPSDLLFSLPGEEGPLPQVRGAAQLAWDQLRPRPHTAPDIPVLHAGVNPFGINLFLEQEVE
ncbi:MAG TPA: hypothetical protein ENK17_01005, partial [Anaerolineae bacterium]|nr:hypothetical protein [Anaerolineae bacterium]